MPDKPAVPVKAFLWDFDGTLADTRRKNFEVTRALVSAIAPDAVDTVAVVREQVEYDRCHRRITNWREFYLHYLGFSEEETDRAGLLWSEYQLKDLTRVPFFKGVVQTLRTLRNYPHAIVSQNARPIIEKALLDEQLHKLFKLVVGYAEVPIRSQKPQPDGLLLCLERLLNGEPAAVLYVGDHQTDAETARNANRVLAKVGSSTRVFSVAAGYGLADMEDWTVQPHFVAHDPGDILEIKNQIENSA